MPLIDEFLYVIHQFSSVYLHTLYPVYVDFSMTGLVLCVCRFCIIYIYMFVTCICVFQSHIQSKGPHLPRRLSSVCFSSV